MANAPIQAVRTSGMATARPTANKGSRILTLSAVPSPGLAPCSAATGARPWRGGDERQNILLPLFAVGLAVAMPLVRTAWIGAFAMTAATSREWPSSIRRLAHEPGGSPGPGAPVLVLACIGYGILGTCTRW